MYDIKITPVFSSLKMQRKMDSSAKANLICSEHNIFVEEAIEIEKFDNF